MSTTKKMDEAGSDRRRYRRWTVAIPSRFNDDGGTRDCTIYDLSPMGAGVELVGEQGLAVGTTVTLQLAGYGAIASETRHSSPGRLGMKFKDDEATKKKLSEWLVATRPPRPDTRHECQLEASIRLSNVELPAVVTNISRTGAAITTAEAHRLVISSEVILVLPGYGTIAAEIRHIEGDNVGLMLIDGYYGELPPNRSRKDGRIRMSRDVPESAEPELS